MMLEAHNVSFGYAKQQTLLDNWSAEFPSAKMTAITGPSGRGKSTLLYLLGLMLAPAAGSVRVAGVDTTTLTDGGRARLRATSFGFVFQDAALDPTRTVLENVTEVALYRGESRTRLREQAVGLLRRFGVDVPADRRPGQVSGGQAQRIALCRALLTTPQIVLADEPTGNLDPVSADVVTGALRDAADNGATVVIVTHSADVAAACDTEITL